MWHDLIGDERELGYTLIERVPVIGTILAQTTPSYMMRATGAFRKVKRQQLYLVSQEPRFANGTHWHFSLLELPTYRSNGWTVKGTKEGLLLNLSYDPDTTNWWIVSEPE